MGKGIYTYYKDRLIEISGKSKCLYLKSIVKKCAYDIGRLFQGRKDKLQEFTSFLWSDNNRPLTLISTEESAEILVKVNTMINELCPQVSLYQNQKLYACKAGLDGINVLPNGYFYVSEWFWK